MSYLHLEREKMIICLSVVIRKSVEFPHDNAIFNTFSDFGYVVFFTCVKQGEWTLHRFYP